MAQFDFKKATLTIQDGASHSIILKIANGDCSWDVKRPRKYIDDRGTLDMAVDGSQEPCSMHMSLVWENVTGYGGSVTPEDALEGIGGASGWTSTDVNTCNAYSVDLVLVYVACGGAGNTETVTFKYFRVDTMDYNAREGMLVVSGRCNVVRPTAVRS